MASPRAVTLEIENASEFQRELERAGTKVEGAVKAALYREATDIMAESYPMVPWDVGTLAGSGKVNRPKVVPFGVEIEFGYGGAASDYAEVQHENMGYRHPRGGQAKYLLTAVQWAAATLDESLAAHTRWYLNRMNL